MTNNETLRKVTLNLFDSDVEDLGQLYGHGWSTIVRELVHQHIKDRQTIRSLPLTLGDFANGK